MAIKNALEKTWVLPLSIDGWRYTDPVKAPIDPLNKQWPNSLLIPFVYPNTIEIPITRYEGSAATPRRMWEESDMSSGGQPRPQTLTINTTDAIFGDECIQIVSEGGSSEAGSMFLWYLTNTGSPINNILYMHEFMQTEDFGRNQSWTSFDFYNRMRLWVVTPPELNLTDVQNENFHFATYLRGINNAADDQESNNGHFYHYFSIPYLGGNPAQIIVDPHPSHQRGGSGSYEHGVLDTNSTILADFNSPGYNYFDLMTNWYITQRYGLTSYPATFLVDGVEIYHDPNVEDIENIYSMWGGVDAQTNELVVGWNRHKNRDGEPQYFFTVKYATSSFHTNGGFSAHGTIAPNGVDINPPGSSLPNGNNGVQWRAAIGVGLNEIDTTGLDYIYIAVKMNGSVDAFREIRIPLTQAGFPVIGK